MINSHHSLLWIHHCLSSHCLSEAQLTLNEKELLGEIPQPVKTRLFHCSHINLVRMRSKRIAWDDLSPLWPCHFLFLVALGWSGGGVRQVRKVSRLSCRHRFTSLGGYVRDQGGTPRGCVTPCGVTADLICYCSRSELHSSQTQHKYLDFLPYKHGEKV